MAADRDRGTAEGGGRFSTAARLRTLGGQAAAKVYRAKPQRRSRLTGRAALLALVVCSLVVALAYPMRQWVSQQSEIVEQQRQAKEAAAAVEELRDEKSRWQDPAHVEQQAREHLHYVRPGETGYTLIEGGPGGVNADGANGDGRGTEVRRSGDSAPGGAADRPWYRNLWDGVDRADAGG